MKTIYYYEAIDGDGPQIVSNNPDRTGGPRRRSKLQTSSEEIDRILYVQSGINVLLRAELYEGQRGTSGVLERGWDRCE